MPGLNRWGRTPRARGALLLLALLVAGGAWRSGSLVKDHLRRGPWHHHDLYLQLLTAKHLREADVLYETENQGHFVSSMEMYKYPPTLVAILTPFVDRPPRQVVRLFLLADFALLIGSLALMIGRLKPGWLRALLILALFLNWQPFWESIDGLQLEVPMLFLLALTLFAIRTGRGTLAGIPVGIAGALKIYPAAVLAYFLLKRRWKVLLGAAGGGVATLGLASLVVGFHHTADFLLHVLPRTGGTSVSHENLSLLAFAGRLALLLTLGPAKAALRFASIYLPLEASPPPGALAIAIALAAAAAIVLVVATVRIVRHGRPLEAPEEDGLMLGSSLCLLLLIAPTSRMDYQTLLALPMCAAVTWAPEPRRDPLTWTLLALAAIPAMLMNANKTPWTDLPVLTSILRGWVPIWLWAALMRLRYAPEGSLAPRPAVVARVEAAVPQVERLGAR
jgi:hypothetical protein